MQEGRGGTEDKKRGKEEVYKKVESQRNKGEKMEDTRNGRQTGRGRARVKRRGVKSVKKEGRNRGRKEKKGCRNKTRAERTVTSSLIIATTKAALQSGHEPARKIRREIQLRNQLLPASMTAGRIADWGNMV